MQVTFLKIYTWALSRNITLKRVLWFDKFSKSRIIFYSWWQSMYISVSGLFRILKWGKLFNFVDQSIFQTSGEIFSQRNEPEACPKWAVWKINPKEFMADAAKHSRVFRLCKYLVKATPQVPSSSWRPRDPCNLPWATGTCIWVAVSIWRVRTPSWLLISLPQLCWGGSCPWYSPSPCSRSLPAAWFM